MKKIKVKYDDQYLATGVLQHFSSNTSFVYDNSKEEIRCFNIIAEYLLSVGNNVALYGNGDLLNSFLKHTRLNSQICCVLTTDNLAKKTQTSAIKTIDWKDMPQKVDAVLLCEPITFRRWQVEKKLKQINPNVKIISPEVLSTLNWRTIPERGWVDAYETIYPIDIPEIEFKSNQDLILIDCPARNLSMLPNGLAYVHGALKKTGINFQTVDLDVIFYHRFHAYRLFDTSNARIVLPSGKELPEDPWQPEHHGCWKDPEMLEFLRPWLDEVITGIVEAKPKVLALSVQECNAMISEEIVKGVKEQLPQVAILVGGYNCRFPNVGLRGFPLADYMAMGEADLSIGPFITKLLNGEDVKNTPGFISRYDTPDWKFEPGPLPDNLDQFGFPKYEWTDVRLYRNWNHYQLTPVHATRGCCWGRCRFCAEAVKFRKRSAKSFVNEIEWLYNRGCHVFMFNESDMNGDPQLLLDICEEIRKRNLFVRFVGQLRIDRRNTAEFFQKLRQGGVVSLRFGVDGWSQHALKLQNKGYNLALVRQNLRDCKAAGITIEVNAVIGVPGETDQDINEAIELFTESKPYIDRIASLNPLILSPNSIYWNDAEQYHIKFKGDKNKIYQQHPHAIPAHLWYSEKPYIDSQIRQERFKKIVLTLDRNGLDVAGFVKQVLKDMESGVDTARGTARRSVDSEANKSEIEV